MSLDFILINCPKNFQESSTLETGLSDFHKMVLTVFKSEAPNLILNHPRWFHIENINTLVVTSLN